MKRILLIKVLVLLMLALSGCLYPEAERAKNSGPVDVHIASVEDAIKRFHQATKVYPIQNSTVNTPIYEKYIIDMAKLYPQYMGYLPENAFEKGGPHLYVLVNIESEPAVKLIDLTISSKVESMQRLINEYAFKNGVYPLGDRISDVMYTIDYEKLKTSLPKIISPFTDKSLPLIVSQAGEVFVDYSLDIGIYINQGKTFSGTDAREILVQHSFFVPVKSVPYEWKDGELKLVK